MEEICYGELGLTERDLCSLSLCEFARMYAGWARRRSFELEKTRAICYTLSAIHRSSKKQMPSIQKYWPLSTDDENEVSEKINEAFERLELIRRLEKEGRL